MNKKVSWKSDKPEIAAVDANGKVTGVAAGEATITATSAADPTRKGACTVTVSADQVGIEFGGYGPEENW